MNFCLQFQFCNLLCGTKDHSKTKTNPDYPRSVLVFRFIFPNKQNSELTFNTHIALLSMRSVYDLILSSAIWVLNGSLTKGC